MPREYGSLGAGMRDMKVCEGYIMSRAKLEQTCPERAVPMRTCLSGDAVSLGHSAASDVRQLELCALEMGTLARREDENANGEFDIAAYLCSN